MDKVEFEILGWDFYERCSSMLLYHLTITVNNKLYELKSKIYGM